MSNPKKPDSLSRKVFDLEHYFLLLKQDTSLVLSAINWLDEASQPSCSEKLRKESINHALALLEIWQRGTYEHVLPELDYVYSEALKSLE
jgi:hypothetical protein